MTRGGPLRLMLICTGLGRIARGYESFFAEVHDRFAGDPRFEVRLLAGSSGSAACRTRRALPLLFRHDPIAQRVARALRRPPYTIEQISALPAVVAEIRAFRPHVVYTSEANLGLALRRLRGLIRVPYRFLFSNGGPITGPFAFADLVQQVAPVYRDDAVARGDEAERQVLLPYGFAVPSEPPDRSPAAIAAAKRALGLPPERKVVLSVGRIAADHKRMDYVVNEVAGLDAPRPYLVLLGARDAASPPIENLARARLGGDVRVRSVPQEEVAAHYRAADAFVLASLGEGFGRVYVEALAAGVPVLSHDYPVGRYVNGAVGRYGDFTREGALAALLTQALAGEDEAAAAARWRHARDRFSWDALDADYEAMFRQAAEAPRRGEGKC